MALKLSEESLCGNCDNFTFLSEPQPAFDKRGRPHIDYNGMQAYRGHCSQCGAEKDNILMAPWQDWRIVVGIVVGLFFVGWCGFGVYLFGYWSWRDTGGLTGWPIGSYIWTAVAAICGIIISLIILGCVFATARYFWVKRRPPTVVQT